MVMMMIMMMMINNETLQMLWHSARDQMYRLDN